MFRLSRITFLEVSFQSKTDHLCGTFLLVCSYLESSRRPRFGNLLHCGNCIFPSAKSVWCALEKVLVYHADDVKLFRKLSFHMSGQKVRLSQVKFTRQKNLFTVFFHFVSKSNKRLSAYLISHLCWFTFLIINRITNQLRAQSNQNCLPFPFTSVASISADNLMWS